MIIKILGSSGVFNGVDYNERKSADGKSELLLSKNFYALELKGGDISKQDYIDYLIDYSSSNNKVKDSQFHVTISGEGRQYSFDQLVGYAEKYLDYMGYADNPCLIYAHSDTPNNHIHIVTSRIGQDGKKINDSYEKVRSQNFIAKVINLDPLTQMNSSLDHSKSFNFSTEGQFRLLMENQGFTVSLKDDSMAFIKGGVKQGELKLSNVRSLLTEKADYDLKRVAQVKQLFNKYKDGFDTNLKWKGDIRPGRNESGTKGRFVSDFSDQMKKKFGLELIYHISKDNKVHSYSIIDHNKKQVYKGSEILNFRDLLKSGRGGRSNDTMMEQVNDAVSSKIGFTELRQLLKKQGVVLNSLGAIKMRGHMEPILTMEPEILKILKYQSRLIEANKFFIPGEKEAKALARYSHVSVSDLNISSGKSDSKGLRAKLDSVFFNHSDIKKGMKTLGIDVFTHNSDIFLMDREDKVIVSASFILNVDEIQDLTESFDFNKDYSKEAKLSTGTNIENQQTVSDDFRRGPESDLVSLEEIANLIGGIHDESDPAESAAKRRKRSR